MTETPTWTRADASSLQLTPATVTPVIESPDSLRGDYRPLNGGGLVVTNPPTEPHQAYSWLVFDGGEDLVVTSSYNYSDLGDLHIDDVGGLPCTDQQRLFGGTFAPTLRLTVDGDRTRLVNVLGHGHFPTKSESLPAVSTPLYARSDIDYGHVSPAEAGYTYEHGGESDGGG